MDELGDFQRLELGDEFRHLLARQGTDAPEVVLLLLQAVLRPQRAILRQLLFDPRGNGVAVLPIGGRIAEDAVLQDLHIERAGILLPQVGIALLKGDPRGLQVQGPGRFVVRSERLIGAGNLLRQFGHQLPIPRRVVLADGLEVGPQGLVPILQLQGRIGSPGGELLGQRPQRHRGRRAQGAMLRQYPLPKSIRGLLLQFVVVVILGPVGTPFGQLVPLGGLARRDFAPQSSKVVDIAHLRKQVTHHEHQFGVPFLDASLDQDVLGIPRRSGKRSREDEFQIALLHAQLGR